MAQVKRHPRIVLFRDLLSQVESPLLKDLPNYGQYPFTLSETQHENIKLLNGASGGNFRRSCDITLKELGNLELKVSTFTSKAIVLPLLIRLRLEKIQDTTAKVPSNDLFDAMDKITRVLKGIITVFDEIEGELEGFHLELIKREMYMGFVLKEVLPL
ncbi:MAG: hypothetical protein Q9192_005092 [Flavoplaca navasiana]